MLIKHHDVLRIISYYKFVGERYYNKKNKCSIKAEGNVRKGALRQQRNEQEQDWKVLKTKAISQYCKAVHWKLLLCMHKYTNAGN